MKKTLIKKITAVVLVTLFTMACTLIASADTETWRGYSGENVAPNGSFEDQAYGILDGDWSFNEISSEDAIVYSPTDASDGEYYIKLDGGEGNNYRCETLFYGIEPDSAYILRFDYQSTKLNVAYVNVESTYDNTKLVDLSLPEAKDGWVTKEILFRTRACDEDTLLVRLRKHPYEEGCACYDNVKLFKLEGYDTTNVVENGNFESDEIDKEPFGWEQSNTNSKGIVKAAGPGVCDVTAEHKEGDKVVWFGNFGGIQNIFTISNADGLKYTMDFDTYVVGGGVQTNVWMRAYNADGFAEYTWKTSYNGAVADNGSEQTLSVTPWKWNHISFPIDNIVNETTTKLLVRIVGCNNPGACVDNIKICPSVNSLSVTDDSGKSVSSIKDSDKASYKASAKYIDEGKAVLYLVHYKNGNVADIAAKNMETGKEVTAAINDIKVKAGEDVIKAFIWDSTLHTIKSVVVK